MNIKKFISKKTWKVRYGFMDSIMKVITPSMYHKAMLMRESIGRIPRPSILNIKQKYNDVPLVGAEIGVEYGRNSDSILKELNMKKLYLIDVWDSYDGYKENRTKQQQIENYNIVLKKYMEKDNVEIIKDFSHEAVDKIKDSELDFVYIDGNHQYDFVYSDIVLYCNKVKINGVVGGHDIQIIDVVNAVKKYTEENNYIPIWYYPDWFFIKTKEPKQKYVIPSSVNIT